MTPTSHRERPACRSAATLAALLLLGLGACAAPGPPHDDHAGRVWSEAAQRFVEPAMAIDAARRAKFLLLGETHDIGAHHELQARLIEAAAEGRRPAVVFEMIRRDQQPAIDRWRQQGADPGTFGEAVEWEQRGWPDWSLYQPIVEVATALDLPLYGGAPGRETLRRVGHDGLAALDPDRRQALRLERPLPDPGRGRLERVLRGAHCGAGGDEMVAAMLAVQRLRDAALADRLEDTAARHGAAVLIAGRGHTRTDHGVPLYLDADRARIVSIGFVGTGEIPDLESLRTASGGAVAQDYIWFTPGGTPVPACGED